MKEHFSDICSNGDRIINQHLDDMYNNQLIEEYQLIDYIYDVWKNQYVEGLKADPWWAS